MRTVADWLTSLGLAKYDTLFADNEIDWAVLPRLTDADLKDFGLPPGRKKLLDASRLSPPPSNATTASSPSSWATACSPTSGTLRPTRATPPGAG